MNCRRFGWSIVVALVISVSTTFAQQDLLPSIPKGNIAIQLTPIATGMAAPLYGINPPGDASRLFVLEQNGLVRIIQNGALQPGSALDLQSRVQTPSGPLNAGSANDERGLLGLAFHPGFNNPNSVGFRTLYTYSSEALSSPTFAAPNGASQAYMNLITEWKMSAGDPNVVDPASRRPIISFGKNASNHNGGTIAFSPLDGYLYLALGDGGNANDSGPSHIDPGGNAQNLTTPLGKMIRIDPINPSLTTGSPNAASANGQYRIPADNPFTGAGELREIYARGLRNPYRFAFDTLNGDLIQADVGQNNVEEIDRITKGGNYGWAIKEGTFLFNSNGTVGANSPGSPAGLIDPINNGSNYLIYDHQDGISITGGFVYRGTAIPELYGKYIFGDLALVPGNPRVDGRLFYADLQTALIKEFLIPQFANDKLPNNLTVHGFGQDASGELYAMVTNTPPNGITPPNPPNGPPNFGGIVYKLTAVPEPATATLLLTMGAAMAAAIRRRRAS